MGSQGSKSKYGGVAIQTDSAYAISGQPVTGQIFVQIDQYFPAKKLKIKIKGNPKDHISIRQREVQMVRAKE
jgi:hypothetical protein